MGIFNDLSSFLKGGSQKDTVSSAEQEVMDQFNQGISSLKDIIAPAAFKAGPTFLEIDGKFATTLFVTTFPRYLDTNWFAPIVNFDVEFDTSMFIYPQDSAAILRQLKKRITQVSASIAMESEAGKVRDPQLETAYQDIEELRDRLVQGTERFYQYSLYITLYGNSKEDLDEVVSQMESLLEGRLIYSKPALFQMEQGFSSTMPLGHDELSVSTNMNTSPLSTSFPFVSSDLTSNSGILYGINLHNSSLVLFDRFSLENANMVIFAKSGAGKSVKGSEPVLVRQKGQVQLRPIQDVIDELIRQHGITYADDELEGVALPELEVYSFNQALKGEWSRVTVAARKDAPKTFYKFTTRSGREITTTGDHNMLVLRDGKVQVVKSTAVGEGESIPLPRSISFETQDSPHSINLLNLLQHNPQNIYVRGAHTLINKHYQTLKTVPINTKLDRYLYKYKKDRAIPLTYFLQILSTLNMTVDNISAEKLTLCAKNGKTEHSLPITLPLTTGLFRLFGYIVAEGTIKKDLVIISNMDQELLQDAGATLKKLGIPFYYTDRSLVIAARVFVKTLHALGLTGKSSDKHVPSVVFESSLAMKSAFLAGYFEGDGGVERSSISITSKSKALVGEISYLLYAFGIVGRIAKIHKEAVGQNWSQKKPYWKCTISGQNNLRAFSSSIQFVSKRKQQALAQIISGQENTNVDLVPEVSRKFKELDKLFGWQFRGIHQISSWKHSTRMPSRQSLRKAVYEMTARVQRFKDLEETFRTLGEMPEFENIVSQGQSDKNLNRLLWEELGQSWRTIKTEKRRPYCQNAFKVIKTVSGQNFELSAVKQAVSQGMREVSLPVKYQEGHLQSALVARPQSNTAYHTIHRTAHLVWDRYLEIKTDVIPKVEQLLFELKLLSEADLFWDEVIHIQKIVNKTDKYVYDMTVDNEVFLSGYGGMFVHNSYTVKLEILRSLMFGTEVIVIDPEQEYRYLSDAVGGSYLRIAIASDHRINPFDLPELKDDENPESVLRENITRLNGLISLMANGFSPEEQSIVDKGLWETYALKDITPGVRWDKPEVPTLQDFYNILKDMEGGKNTAVRLQRFVEGTFAGVFNRPTNISLDKHLIVFNIRDMEEELRPIAMYVVLGFIWNRVRSSLKQRLLVVDEAWIMMQNEESARFLFSMAKRARKYYLGVTTITQDISDFLQSKYGKPIVTNSSLQLLLRQSPAAIDLLGEVFYLTDHEKMRLLESDVGEGIFFAGLKHVAIKIIASYAEDQIITSDPQQILAIEAAKKEMSDNS